MRRHRPVTVFSATPHPDVWARYPGRIIGLGGMGLLVSAAMWLALTWATAGISPDMVPWYVVRAAGLVAYVLLWISVTLGLWISGGWTPRANAQLVALHEFASLVALSMTFLHVITLRADAYLQPSWIQIWVPLAMTTYRPLAVAAGQIGFYLMVAVVLSFYVRRWIGARVWRGLHAITFLLYGLVLVHAVAAGTESATPVWQGIYLVTGGSVLVLTYLRLAIGRSGRGRTR